MEEKKKIVVIGYSGIGKSLAYQLAKNQCGLPIVVSPKGSQFNCRHCGHDEYIKCDTVDIICKNCERAQ